MNNIKLNAVGKNSGRGFYNVFWSVILLTGEMSNPTKSQTRCFVDATQPA